MNIKGCVFIWRGFRLFGYEIFSRSTPIYTDKAKMKSKNAIGMVFKKKNAIGIILLLLTAFIWGSSFVAQSDAMDHIGPFTMNGLRSLLAAIALFIALAIIQSAKSKKFALIYPIAPENRKKTITAGLLCGLLITAATTIQQFGIERTTVGRSGFITALYIIIVPLMGLMLGKRPKWNLWVAVCVALVGFAFICLIGSNFQLSVGDLLVLISAVFFAAHILAVEKFASDINGVLLSFMQFSVCAVVDITLALIFESPNFGDIFAAWWPIVYAGVFSGGIAYTFQILGQKNVPATAAVLIMSLEAVFAAVSARILKGEVMTTYEFIGSTLVFAGVVLAQLDFSKFKKSKIQNEPLGADDGGESEKR